MDNDCSKYTSLIYDYIDNETDELKRDELERHLKECPDCNRYFQKIFKTDNALKQIYDPGNLPIDEDKVWKKIDSRMDWDAPFWVRAINGFFKPAVWAPALCTAAIALFVIYFSPMDIKNKQIMVSRVVEVSSTGGNTMILETDRSHTPLIMFIPNSDKEAG